MLQTGEKMTEKDGIATESGFTELQEDCLVNILRKTEGSGSVTVSDLSSFMGASPDDMSVLLAALSSEGKVTLAEGSVSLTEGGLALAREIRKKHHVMETFLMDVLGMDHESAHRQAHRMEHGMSQESMRSLCHITGDRRDSDCSSCLSPCSTMIQIGSVVSLFDVGAGARGKIAFLRSGDDGDVKKLISMGFVPGREVSVDSRVSSKGPRVVRLGDSTVAVDANLSKAIMVNVGI